MEVLVTGATGYIGSAVAEALQAASHTVVGLARSEEAAQRLEARKIRAHRGDLTQPESVAAAARAAEGVIHAANTNGPDAAQADRAAVEAVLAALEGSGKPFVYTSGIWVLGNTGEKIADENSPLNPTPLIAWRAALEPEIVAAARRGVRSVVIRPAIVYGHGGGIIGGLVKEARERGAARYIGSGENRWPLVYVEDLADLYVRALERAPAGTVLNATAGPPIRFRELAEAVARAAGVGGRTESWPLEEARKELGPYADALALDQQASGEKAKRLLGWSPGTHRRWVGPGVLEELARGAS